jgi:hypothetical protein
VLAGQQAEQDSATKMAGWQAQMTKDPGNGRWTLDGGNNFQGTPAVGAVSDIDIEHPFE